MKSILFFSSFLIVHSFGRRMLYPGSVGLLQKAMRPMLQQGQARLIEEVQTHTNTNNVCFHFNKSSFPADMGFSCHSLTARGTSLWPAMAMRSTQCLWTGGGRGARKARPWFVAALVCCFCALGLLQVCNTMSHITGGCWNVWILPQVICCEGNAGFYEVGCMNTPLEGEGPVLHKI